MLSTSGFVDDVIFLYNRLCKRGANEACIQNDSSQDRGRSMLPTIALLIY